MKKLVLASIMGIAMLSAVNSVQAKPVVVSKTVVVERKVAPARPLVSRLATRAVIRTLPRGYTVVRENGRVVYRVNNVRYRRVNGVFIAL